MYKTCALPGYFLSDYFCSFVYILEVCARQKFAFAFYGGISNVPTTFVLQLFSTCFFLNLSPRERPKMTSNLLWRVIWSEAINIGLALFLVNWSLLSVRFMDQIYSNVAWFNQVCYTYSPIHYEYWPYKGLHIFSFKLRIDSYLPISVCLLG